MRITNGLARVLVGVALIGAALAHFVSPAAAESAALTWSPPSLTDPTTVYVSSANRDLRLDATKDYRLVMASPVTSAGGLIISGGRNVVLIGGEIIVPTKTVAPVDTDRRGLYLKGQTGTIHIEGLHIGGADLSEGIDLDERAGATVQLQNILVDTVHGTQATNHADVIQTWSGPNRMRIDRLMGTTTYQGFFLLPHQYPGGAVDAWDFRNVDLTGTPESGYLLWKEDNQTVASTNVRLHKTDGATTKLFWPSAAAWNGAAAMPADSVLNGAPGMTYVSPGYVSSASAVPATTTTSTTSTTLAPTTTTTAAPTPIALPVAPIVNNVPAVTPRRNGYWMVSSDGGVFSFGDAGFFGSTGGMKLNRPVVTLSGTPAGKGYWLVASDGGIFAFGDARFFGSTGGINLNKPIVGMAATPSGNGYWLVASDGGIFAFGDAAFFGSTGSLKLTQPIVAMTTTPTGKGYWMAAADGGLFAFGDAGFYGSASGKASGRVTGMQATASGSGYWMASTSGWVGAFGDAGNYGSLSGLNSEVVGASAIR